VSGVLIDEYACEESIEAFVHTPLRGIYLLRITEPDAGSAAVHEKGSVSNIEIPSGQDRKIKIHSGEIPARKLDDMPQAGDPVAVLRKIKDQNLVDVGAALDQIEHDRIDDQCYERIWIALSQLSKARSGKNRIADFVNPDDQDSRRR